MFAMDSSRRQFMKNMAMLPVYSAGLGVLPYVVRTVYARSTPTQFLMVNKQGRIGKYDFATQTFTEVEAGIMEGHGYIANPHATNEVMIVAKYGPQAIRFDHVSMKVLQTYPATKGRLFYGHGQYSAKRNLMYTVEAPVNYFQGAGAIVFRDPITFLPKGEFSTNGLWPHDIQLFEDENIIAVTNNLHEKNDFANISLFDLHSHKLIKTIKAPEPYMHLVHIAKGMRCKLIASTNKKELTNENAAKAVRQQMTTEADYTSFKKLEETLFTHFKPAPANTLIVNSQWEFEEISVQSEQGYSAFDVATDTRDAFAVTTHGKIHSVVFYNLQSQKVHGHYTFTDKTEPLGCIGFDKGKFLVNSFQSSIWLFDVNKIDHPQKLPATLNGSHFYLI